MLGARTPEVLSICTKPMPVPCGVGSLDAYWPTVPYRTTRQSAEHRGSPTATGGAKPTSYQCLAAMAHPNPRQHANGGGSAKALDYT